MLRCRIGGSDLVVIHVRWKVRERWVLSNWVVGVKRCWWFKAWHFQVEGWVHFWRRENGVAGEFWVSDEGLVKVGLVVDCIGPISTN